MTREKVKLTYIQNDQTRKLTFKKRKKGLLKKMSELTILCDVQACAIIYGKHDTQAEVWPSSAEVQRTYVKFKTMPPMEQTKKQLNMETFLRQRIEKAKDQLRKQKKENHEKEMSVMMSKCLTRRSLQGFNMEDLNDLGWMIDHKVEEINRKMKKVSDELAQNEQSKPCSKNITATSDQRQNDEHAASSGSTHGDDDPTRPSATSANGGA